LRTHLYQARKKIKFKKKRTNKFKKKKTENNLVSLEYNYRKRRAKDSTHDLMLSVVGENFLKNKHN